MNITSVNQEEVYGQNVDNFYFDNDMWVGITATEGLWEMQHEDDEESYTSGHFSTDGVAIMGFSGCDELPKEVRKAFKHQGYKLFV